MLGKLIKYEFRATARVMLPLIVGVILLSLLSGFAILRLDSETDYGFLTVVFVLFIVIFMLLVFAMCVMAVVLMIERFYKNLLSSEGYLMFTLPVSVDGLIWAKLIVSFVWFAVTALVSMLAVMLMALIGANFAIGSEELGRFWEELRALLSYVGVGHILGYVLELVLVFFACSVFSCLQFYFPMAIGQCFANHKLLWSIVFFFALSVALSLLTGLFFGGVFGGFFSSASGADFLRQLGEAFERLDTRVQVHIALLGFLVSSILPSLILYFPTAALLKKRLNLA